MLMDFTSGLLLLILSGIYCFLWLFWKNQLSLTSYIIEEIINIIKKYPALIYIYVINCILGVFWYTIIIFTFIACIIGHKNVIFSIFCCFSLYYSSQVIENIVSMTTTGLLTTYFFCSEYDPTTKTLKASIKDPTLKAYKRSMTTYIGSICFGSLFIFIIKVLTNITNCIKKLKSCICCTDCILFVLESLIHCFSIHAFPEIVIYGKSYCEASRSTFLLMKYNNVNIILEDNIFGNILIICKLTISCLIGSFSSLIGYMFNITNSVHLIIYGIIGFIISYFTSSISLQLVNSGFVTFFMCLCEDHEYIKYIKQDLYEKIKKAYPQCQI